MLRAYNPLSFCLGLTQILILFFSNFLATFLTIFSSLFTHLLSAVNDLNVNEKAIKC